MRLFFALDLPRALKESLAAFQARSRALPLGASWTEARRLHLTLAFLGEQPEERLPLLRAIGAEVAQRHSVIQSRTSILGAFPRSPRARVLWLGLEENAALDALAADLREALRREGVPMDEKPFAAHLTLARFRRPVDIALLGKAPDPLPFEAPELLLFQSRLGPQGSRYERLGAFPFQG